MVAGKLAGEALAAANGAGFADAVNVVKPVKPVKPVNAVANWFAHWFYCDLHRAIGPGARDL